VAVSVGSTTRLDLQIKVAAVTQDVTVQAHAAVIDTESGSGGVLLNSSQVTNLPLNGRNSLQLVALSPNVTADFANGGRQVRAREESTAPSISPCLVS